MKLNQNEKRLRRRQSEHYGPTASKENGGLLIQNAQINALKSSNTFKIMR